MVASAAMAGVPLLNGFLSKEMFFAETIVTHDEPVLDRALPYIATLATALDVTYSLRFIQGDFFGPPPVDLPERKGVGKGQRVSLRVKLWGTGIIQNKN